MSTIGSKESERFAKEVSSCGGYYIECPVLGSTPHAESGNLQLLVTCSKELMEMNREVFEVLGKIRYIGDQYGKSSVFKLALNQMIVAQMSSFAFAVSLLKTNDLPLDLFSEIVRGSSFHSKYFDLKFNNMATGNYNDRAFILSTLKKDVGLVVEELNNVNIDPSVMEAVIKQCDFAINLGFGDFDGAAIIEGVMPKKE